MGAPKSTQKLKDFQTKISLKGIIAPADWDNDFNVNQIKISSEEEKDLLRQSSCSNSQ